MAKPGYGMLYAIVIILGILVVVLFNRLMNSEEAAPAVQVGAQRSEAVAQAAEAQPEKTDPPASAEGREAAPAVDKPDAMAARPSPAATGGEEEERK